MSGGEGTELRGLSRYLVSDEGGELRVWSKRYGRWKTRSCVHRAQGVFFTLVADDGKVSHWPEGALRFLLANPEVPALAVAPTRGGLRFHPDGTPMGAVPMRRAYNVFGSIDDALATVLLMKRAAAGGGEALAAGLAQEWRHQAQHAVTKLLGCPRTRVENAWDDGLELFTRKLTECNLQRIVPLYALLCMSLKVAVKMSERRHGGPVTDRCMLRLQEE